MLNSLKLFNRRPVAGLIHSWKLALILIFPFLAVWEAHAESEIMHRAMQATIYVDLPITEENSPRIEVIVIGGGMVEVTWFYGSFTPDHVSGNPTPANNTLVKTESKTEPDFTEEEQYYYVFKLIGSVLQGDHTIWASVKTPDLETNVQFEIQVDQGVPPPPPVEKGWAETWPLQQPDSSIPSLPEHYVKWNKVFSGYIRGTDFSKGYTFPYLDVNFPGPWTISFYRGEAGDTSSLIYSATQAEASPVGGAWFDRYVVDGTTRIWARVENNEGSLDSNPIIINSIDPADVELTYWPDTIKDADVGSNVTLTPEFNIHMSGSLTAWIYRGESGDTSQLVSQISATDIPVLSITVPSAPSYFWARIQYGDFIIDTPTTLVSPLPIEAPVITDQPDDALIPVNWWFDSLFGRAVGATGGQLNFQWYEGLPGDRSRLLGFQYSPISEGNIRVMSVNKPSVADTIYVRVWNSRGVVDSRPLHVRTYMIDDSHFLNYPLRVRLRQQDLLQAVRTSGRFDFFWCDHWLVTSDVKLMKEVNGSFVDVHTSSFAGGFPFYFNFRESDKRVIAASLPSGIYRYRVFYGEQFFDSEPFEFFNECVDANPVEVVPAAFPMAPAGIFSDGGIFTAKVYLTTFIDADSMRVYAGPIGDRSNPVRFTHDHSPLYSQLYSGMDFGQYVVTIEWASTGQDMYWFEASTHYGKPVRCVLRYPQLGSESSGENGHVTNVLLPPGSDVIPVPNLDSLPNVAAWRIGEQDGQGTRVRLPLEVYNFNQSNTSVTMWNGQGLPVEQLSIEIDPDAPPQFLDDVTQAAVLPSGRVLWTSSINGDVNRTVADYRIGSGDWLPVIDTYSRMTQGFMVPAGASELRVRYMMDDKLSERTYRLIEINADFLDFAEVSRTEENTLVTERMGTFLNAQEYPQLQHAELGWMHALPLADGILFYGDTAPDRTDWNWMHPEYFPLIYNFGVGRWVYYWVNGYGWFWDYEQENWYRID